MAAKQRLNVSLRSVSVRRGSAWALRDVSLELRAGERWALIGGNGAGKTQLLKLLAADVWPTPTGRESLTYRLAARTLDLTEVKPRIAYIGAELQDKYARYDWNHTVMELLATGLQRSDLLLRPVTKAERVRIASMLELCGLKHLEQRRFLSLSYGQKRLALLARGLVQRPDWLLLDEFYNGLDTYHRSRIDAILDHAYAVGQSWIASAHRAMDVPRGTDGLIELRSGRVHSVSRLSRRALERLAAAAAERSPPRRRRSFSARRRPARASGKLLIDIAAADLYVDYRLVLRDLHWQLRQGEHWAIFGANGAGKSSFLKLLYGDLSPALGGKIERVGFPRGTPVADWKRRVGYVAPELQTDYAVDVTVLELVASGRYSSIGLNDPATRADTRRARRWLEFFALRSFADRRPRELSYGQLRRALFARALSGHARILLLDEPLTGLDPRQRAVMKRLLARLMRRGFTLIIAVHHPEDLPNGMTHELRLLERRAVGRDLRDSVSNSETFVRGIG